MSSVLTAVPPAAGSSSRISVARPTPPVCCATCVASCAISSTSSLDSPSPMTTELPMVNARAPTDAAATWAAGPVCTRRPDRSPPTAGSRRRRIVGCSGRPPARAADSIGGTPLGGGAGPRETDARPVCGVVWGAGSSPPMTAAATPCGLGLDLVTGPADGDADRTRRRQGADRRPVAHPRQQRTSGGSRPRVHRVLGGEFVEPVEHLRRIGRRGPSPAGLDGQPSG